MRYIESSQTDPRWNLALEQYVFETLASGEPVFMLWQNERTIVIGKNQNLLAEINPDYVRRHGLTVVRRLSGGGAVYHDLGNLNFTIVAEKSVSERIDFALFCRPVIETLASYGVTAELSGRNDITIDGRKFSGNAQYIRDNRVLHHGTLMFDSDLTALSRALCVDREKIESKGVKSVSSRVTNLKEHLPTGTSIADFRERLLLHLAATEPLQLYELTAEDCAAVEAIKKARYDTWDWTFGHSPACAITRRQRIEGCGLVEVSMNVKNGRLDGVRFSGDFFGSGDTEELAAILQGCPCGEEELRMVLQNCSVDRYIHNMTAAGLVQLLAPAHCLYPRKS